MGVTRQCILDACSGVSSACEVPPVEQGQAARKAVELEPDLAVAHIRLSQYYKETHDREKPRTIFVVRWPSTRTMNISWIEQLNERLIAEICPTAIATQRRLVARDPLAATVRNNLAVYLLADGQLDQALAEFRNVQAIHPDTDPNVAIDIVHVLILQGHHDEAQAAMSQAPAGSQRDQGLALPTRPPGAKRTPTRRSDGYLSNRGLHGYGSARGGLRVPVHGRAGIRCLQGRKDVYQRAQRSNSPYAGHSSSNRCYRLFQKLAFGPALVDLHSTYELVRTGQIALTRHRHARNPGSR